MADMDTNAKIQALQMQIAALHEEMGRLARVQGADILKNSQLTDSIMRALHREHPATYAAAYSQVLWTLQQLSKEPTAPAYIPRILEDIRTDLPIPGKPAMH